MCSSSVSRATSSTPHCWAASSTPSAISIRHWWWCSGIRTAGRSRRRFEALHTHNEPHGDIAALVSAIKPAVAVAGSRPGDLLYNTIRANVEQSRDQIIASPELKQPLDAGDLNVVTAYYSLNSGEVEFT